MTPAKRQKLLLGALAVAVALVGLRYVGSSDEDEGSFGPLPGARLRGGAAGDPTAEGEVLELKVADLHQEPGEYRPGRDPWRFGEPPPPPTPPPPPPPSKEELERQRLALEQAAREEAERARRLLEEAQRPKPPPITFSYLGSFGPKSRRIAVLADGQTIYNVHEGDVLEGRFEVAHIGFESVDIKFVGFPDWPAQRLAVGR